MKTGLQNNMILKDISLTRGLKIIFSSLNIEFLCPGLNIIKGENGSGKTSLLMMISTLLQEDRGTIIRFGKLKKNNWLNEHILIKQNSSLSDELTIEENLKIWCGLKGWNFNTDKIQKNLEHFGILKYKNSLVSECSSGIKKKAELCKLNFEESFKLKCWLLDEPLNHLDQNGILFLEKIMGKFINMNGTILQTSHEKKINHKNFKLIKL
ncbi:MAG: ATP-binding cassette domain-containing protein [Alphaproteobacteria bacterium]|nr:MAG: ATP-binding cassette domain-containing protein [Alphaproteobacteria bacterium]